VAVALNVQRKLFEMVHAVENVESVFEKCTSSSISKPHFIRSASEPIFSPSKAQLNTSENRHSPSTSAVRLECQSTGHHNGKIHWRSPFTMFAFFFAAVISGVSHHVYYSSLAGKQVGSDDSQQWAPRSVRFAALSPLLDRRFYLRRGTLISLQMG
jgi:hypothetical protein